MSKVLIVYASSEGQTRKIAEYMAEVLRSEGYRTELWDSKIIPGHLEVDQFDRILIGGSVRAGGFQRSLKKWVLHHREILARRHASFFSVCLGVLQDDPVVQDEEKSIVENFFEQTQWHPDFWTIFAGALSYSQYNWFIKKSMQWMARRAGGATDTSRDYEYTNWNDVRHFAEAAVHEQPGP